MSAFLNSSHSWLDAANGRSLVLPRFGGQLKIGAVSARRCLMSKRKPYKRYSPEFKREALKRASEEGTTDRIPDNQAP